MGTPGGCVAYRSPPGEIAHTAPRRGRGALRCGSLSVVPADQPSLRRLQLSVGEDASLVEADEAL